MERREQALSGESQDEDEIDQQEINMKEKLRELQDEEEMSDEEIKR